MILWTATAICFASALLCVVIHFYKKKYFECKECGKRDTDIESGEIFPVEPSKTRFFYKRCVCLECATVLWQKTWSVQKNEGDHAWEEFKKNFLSSPKESAGKK